ncbi:hypothetical protein [Methylobacterium aquaticum]|uniref:hypothetical protein n=1 Tax=Methylobacterium aquaticum TaxID=270351 RepID=UPI0019344528|nr:hypothetical protein [Methylobacterium aquaticum]QRE76497.1 hypothetical protein F1D61_25610 [Methylobacterium aquaticum]
MQTFSRIPAAYDRRTSPAPRGPFLIEMRETADPAKSWIEETSDTATLAQVIRFLIGVERPYAELVEVYELNLADRLAPQVTNVTALVIGMISDRIDRDDEIDGLPDSLEDACRRHHMPGPAEKAPRCEIPFDRLTPACVGVRTGAAW